MPKLYDAAKLVGDVAEGVQDEIYGFITDTVYQLASIALPISDSKPERPEPKPSTSTQIDIVIFECPLEREECEMCGECEEVEE